MASFLNHESEPSAVKVVEDSALGTVEVQSETDRQNLDKAQSFHLDIEEMKDRFGEHSSCNNLVVTEPNQGLTVQNNYSKEVMHSCISGPSTEVGPQLIEDNSCSPADTHKNSIGSGEPRPIKRKLEVDHSEDLKLKKARGELNTLRETEDTGHTVPKKTETKVRARGKTIKALARANQSRYDEASHAKELQIVNPPSDPLPTVEVGLSNISVQMAEEAGLIMPPPPP
jgi:hypothetical protein